MRQLLLLFITLFSLVGCLKDDDYTVSTDDRLAFNQDTIAFDTIISGIPTKTYSMVVYNHADKAIRITQIALQKGASSPFKIQADGASLENGIATDFEIARKDSMIVYLMANVPYTDNDGPIDYTDKLVFTTEAGVNQEVVLKAAGQDVIDMKAQRISHDLTLDAKRPYHVYDSLVVEKGATLTLAAGTQLLFHSKTSLIVYGMLKIEGSLNSPVVLRGDRLDNMFKNQPYDRTPGLWGGVVFKKGAFNNEIRYADIHSGSFGVQIDSTDVTQRVLTMENSIVTTTTNHAISIRQAQAFIGNSQITNAGGDCLHVRGGDVTLIHCTLGRFFVFTGGYGNALNFANFDNEVRLPLKNLQMVNCIITGYQEDEMMGSSNETFQDDAFNYSFGNCLINTPKPKDDDAHFVNCLWDVKDKSLGAAPIEEQILRDKNFDPKFNVDHLLFGFELSEKSQAIGKANVNVTQQYYPNDRLGRARGNAPDIGCYQHQVKKQEDK